MSRISILGAGYVGLVTGACLADRRHQVICVDIDPDKVDQINEAQPPIHEPGLDELLERNVDAGRLRATEDVGDAVRSTELTMIAVGTPYIGESIDLGAIRDASRAIGSAMADLDRYHVVVVKSTVVPGTTDGVVVPLLAQASGRRPGPEFGVGMNPEFLREGEAVEDFMNPDRLVLGGIDDRTREAMDELYGVFPDVDRLYTSNRTAEMIKYVSNSLLATLISFSNEMANLASALGDVDVVDVMEGVHLDRRLNPIQDDGSRVEPGVLHYLEAGCGFGGSCFPKDIRALISHGREADVPMDLLESVIRINERQPERVLELVEGHHPSLRDVSVAVLGLAFKPGTDDVRESPALQVIRRLQSEQARVRAYDPVASESARKVLGEEGIEYSASMEDCVRGADAVIVLTAWEEFGGLPDLLERIGEEPLVVDGRRMLSPDRLARYEAIGA